MHQLSSFLPPVRKAPRYSVRPFYTTIFVFTTLTVLSLLIAWAGKGQAHRATASTLLVKRDGEPEVSPKSYKPVSFDTARRLIFTLLCDMNTVPSSP